MGEMTVSENMWVWYQLLVFSSMTRVNLSWLMNSWGLMTIMFLLKQIREVQRNFLPAFTVFQVPISQNNQYAKAAYFRVACPELLVIFWDGIFCCPSVSITN